MGQYYFPILLADRPAEGESETIQFAFYSHDFGNGLKLMEHSYVGNDFVKVVEKFLAAVPHRIVWAGDYADEENDREGGTLYERTQGAHTRPIVIIGGEEAHGRDTYVIRGARYGRNEVNVETSVNLDLPGFQYFVNLDRREFVDTAQCPSNDGMAIHPLPLLTAEGNGRGGGDYYDEFPGQGMIGLWARDLVQATNTRPGVGFVEVRPGFTESRKDMGVIV